jgi:virulence factor
MLIGIVGLGEIAHKAYLPILASSEGIELALCSRSESSVQRVQQQYRIQRGTTRLEELIAMRPQAAFVLSPSGTHAPLARALLEGGIDVFLEKPATLHSQETQSLAELADRGQRILMVGFNRRYAPLHVRGRQIWQDRPVGMALFEKHRPSASHPNLKHQFYDDTVHQIDLLRFFCGEGQVVSTVEYITHDLLLGAASTVALERGGYAMVVTSLQAGRWQETYTLHGGGQSMIIEAFARLRLLSKHEEMVQEETYASTWRTTLEGRGFNAQIAHFLECVGQRCQPQTTAWDSLKTQLLVEQMVASVTHTRIET